MLTPLLAALVVLFLTYMLAAALSWGRPTLLLLLGLVATLTLAVT